MKEKPIPIEPRIPVELTDALAKAVQEENFEDAVIYQSQLKMLHIKAELGLDVGMSPEIVIGSLKEHLADLLRDEVYERAQALNDEIKRMEELQKKIPHGWLKKRLAGQDAGVVDQAGGPPPVEVYFEAEMMQRATMDEKRYGQ